MIVRVAPCCRVGLVDTFLDTHSKSSQLVAAQVIAVSWLISVVGQLGILLFLSDLTGSTCMLHSQATVVSHPQHGLGLQHGMA